MGGYNSGRRTTTPSTDDCVRLSLSELRRLGAVRRHQMARRYLHWTGHAELTLVVDIECLAPSPCLRITGSAFGRQIDQRLEIVAQSQPFGGERFYIRCPVTGKRCTTLVLPLGGTYFASVRGWNVPYGSQREREVDRALRAIDKLERRFKDLPKYTRAPTRKRLRDRLDRASNVIAREEARLVAMM